MADYPTSKLEKAFAKRGQSSVQRTSWQELMGRHDSVPAKALIAPEVIRGFSGSWAAQYALEEGQKTIHAPESPAPVQRQVNHLGLPGMPEINFRPYDWGTTRHGKYGPSLLGHPVSFQVVGPTTKSPFLVHQWRVDPTGASDVLSLDSCTWRSTLGTPEALPATLNTIEEIYGISAIPEGGLYLVVSLTGSTGGLDDKGGGVPGLGGVGDGLIGHDALAPFVREPLSVLNSLQSQRSKYEIFRVVSMTATTLTLDSSKRLEDHFLIPDPAVRTPVVRSVMLIKPAAARLVAVPGSGIKGKEQTFAFVPPERSLNSDLMPPASMWTTGGSFDPWLNYAAGASVGTLGSYTQDNALPVPKAIRRGEGHLQGITGEVPVVLATGLLRVYVDLTVTFDAAADVGKIVRIYSATRHRGGDLSTATLDGAPRIGDPEIDLFLGYWEVVAADDNAGNPYYNLRMVTQVDPSTGVPFYGEASYMRLSQTGLAATESVQFQWTLHDPISSLWTSLYPQQDKLDSARLSHIIDPDWVQPSLKGFDLTDWDASPARPDRSIFDTASGAGGVDGSNANPGSLLDLGFRVVFFPAMVSGADPTKLVPDFDNPVTSNELVLDASLTEKQFLEVDYSGGLVYLSHPPVVGTGCTLAPDTNILTHASNPRGEMVFFASFVPFSQEPGQRGGTTRVTGGQSIVRPDSSCGTFTESVDVYGARRFWPAATGQTITSGNPGTIQLDVQLDAIDLPPVGFVDVVLGNNVPIGLSVWTDGKDRRINTFGYSEVDYQDPGNGGNTTLLGCFGGGEDGVDTHTVTASNPVTVVLRKEVVTPNLRDGSHGTDFQFDTTFGFSKRASTLRFKNATLTYEPDGSLTVDPADPRITDHQQLFSELFSSWVINGGEMTSGGLGPGFGFRLSFSELTVLIAGVRTVLPAQTLDVSVSMVPPVPAYVYIDGAVPSCPVYAWASSLPLPSSDDVLLGQYLHDAVDVLSYQDMRQPLVDMDKRLDITVGQPTGHDQPGAAHFLTLADAVAYVADTMKPIGGTDGRYRRIKVIGPTLEDETKLPISPATQGIIIEGAARRQDGTVGVPLEIVWRRTANALFDLSGCSGIVMRDLAFRYDDDGVGASVVPRERCLFTLDYLIDDLLRDAVFENIRLNGPAHGFFYCARDLDAATGFEGITFRNCVAKELTDFAVRVESNVVTCTNLRLDKCWFKVRKTADVPGPELNGVLQDNAIVFLRGDTKAACVEDTYLNGGFHGVYLGGAGSSVLHTEINNTDRFGVLVVGRQVTLDALQVLFCHTLAAGAGNTAFALADKVGVYCSGGGDVLKITGSRVTLSGSADTDFSFFAAGGAINIGLKFNEFSNRVTTDTDSWVESNTLFDGLVLGADSYASSNQVDVSTGAGNIEAGPNCTLTGNVAAGNFDINGTALDARLSNNWFKGTAASNTITSRTHCSGDTFDGTVVFTIEGVFTGCRFKVGINDNGIAASTKNRFQGCYFRFTADADILTTDTIFEGNYFESSGGLWTLELDGVRNTVIGNQFDDGWTLYLHDTAVAVRTGLLVQSNIMEGATEGGMFVDGNYCTIQGNVIRGYETASGAPISYGILSGGVHNAICGNVLGSAGVPVHLGISGTDATVIGNRVFGKILTAIATTDSSITGNVTGEKGVSVGNTLEIQGDDLVCEGNTAAGDFSFSATSSICGHNQVDGDAVFSGDHSLYEGNYINGALTLSATDTDLKNTKVRGATLLASGLAPASAVQNITGNSFWGTVDIATADFLANSAITGNYFIGVVNLDNGGAASLLDCTFTGNYVNTTFTSDNADRTVFSGNRFEGATSIKSSPSIVVQGNYVTGDLDVSNSSKVNVTGNQVTGNLILTGDDDYICMGNHVTGDLLIPAGAAATNCGIVIGNRAAKIDDGAAGAMPTNYQVTVANKVDAAGTGTVYGAAPATASQNTLNVKDDA